METRMQFKSECELENIDFNKPLHFEHSVRFFFQVLKNIYYVLFYFFRHTILNKLQNH